MRFVVVLLNKINVLKNDLKTIQAFLFKENNSDKFIVVSDECDK